MDKSCQSSAESTTTSVTTSSATGSNNTSSREHYLRHLNKLSQKISKPIIKKPTFDSSTSSQNQQQQQQQQQQPQQNNTFNNQGQAQAQAQAQQNLQHQPPVYNINKNDFRDVVQKLTGSPAHDRISTPPPIQQPKPPSSRLQRIRPPPLPQITNRPPSLLGRPQQPQPNINVNAVSFNNFSGFGRPLSPLPPFPTVHAPAESPISAYMRDLQNLVSTMDSTSKQFSGFPSLAPQAQPQPQHQHQPSPPPPPEQQQGMVPSQTPSVFQMPSSPVPFGCLNSPLSSYPLLSPGLLFSPNSGQLGFPQLPPLSPSVPVPSPRWRGL
ncbi:VQ motif-containing protein 9 [Gastrolobium bilobum]|uniref:VQ motif-containing protein 9 n=1 Tax=Gastrolobium bilobum TaxID=150636 RepID=UPI002AB274E0|nr:VQ motif-containing protein 9 [Gastrolobium bilobum]